VSLRSLVGRIVLQEDFNFLVTNRIPRRLVTQLVGRISRVRTPWVRDLSIAIWRLFSDLDLSEAKKARFDSLHDCFIRELKDGARPIDPDPQVVVSPCDAIVGACGRIDGSTLLQAKGFPYTLRDLLGDASIADRFRDGQYVTLRLTASMYHRFHAPHDARVEEVRYISGDTWNVNPIALKRVERLFCRNERALISLRLRRNDDPLLLVPIAAILVASIRLTFADVRLHLKYRGPNLIPCAAELGKGEPMGWFEHGSTIIVFAPAGYGLCDDVREGSTIRVGRPLLSLP
jgi:phosphatidylserine decarboxylase